MDDANRIYSAGYFNSNLGFAGTSHATNGMSDIFVARSGADGGSEWMFTGGSPGPDRAFAIATGNSGLTAVTGYFSNNALFGNETVNTNNTSQDFFVMVLDSNGDLVWIRSFGGELGDTGYGIDFDNNGNVLVTGQFRGTIDFDGTVFTSTPLSDGSALSYDTFVLKLSPTGDVLWAKHGQNPYESRGLDIACDDAGNVIVCGQFSDTLTFDQVHFNDIFNAAFVVQFDANGNEQWFRRFTSSQTIAYSLAVNSANEIYVTGDNIGPMLFYTEDGSEYFQTEYTYNLFLAKFTQSGDLEWLTNNGSENPVSSKSIDLDNNEDPYVAGTFNCRFDEYAEPLGTGVFYSAGWRDVFITKFNPQGERLWSRNMASNRDAYCSAIAVNQTDLPVISGGFENRFYVTNASTFINYTGNTSGGSGNANYCGDSAYGSLRGVESNGNKDIFITSPINLNREPLDYFSRSGSDCIRDYRAVCIGSCADSIIVCGGTTTFMNDFIFTHLEPLNDIQWIPPTGISTVNFGIPATGHYTLHYERQDGCMSFTDSVHATVNPVPVPTITDNLGINNNAPPDAAPIELCFPDSVLLMGSNYSETDSIWWSSNSIITPTDSDSAIYAHTQSGMRSFNIINEFGCSQSNDVLVTVYSPIDTLPLEIIFPAYPEPVDTISICINDQFTASLNSLTGDNSILNQLAQNAEITWGILPGQTGIISGSPSGSSASVSATQSGNYTIVSIIEGVCDTLEIMISREIYIEVYPQPETWVNLSGDNTICPGDSTVLTAVGSGNYNWSGPTYQTLNDSTIKVWEPGGYSVSTSTTNEFGCSQSSFDYFQVSYHPTPVVTMQPASGIVCPGDSVLLSTVIAQSWTWVGPNGQVIGTSQSIWVDIPGFYHCIVTNFSNCPLESNFVEVKEYASPYLIADPGTDLCFTDQIEIEAITDPSATVLWGPPLNVFTPSVTVTQPGTYTASVTLCGITTNLEITLFQTDVNAFVQVEGEPTVCNDNTVTLTGNPGMYAYEWQPGGQTTQNITVSEPGEYTLFTYDEQGCSGQSETIVISDGPEVNINVPDVPFICFPDSLQLTVSGNFIEYNWLPGGDTLPSIWVTTPGDYQVTATDENGCSGTAEAVSILPGEAPEIPAFGNPVVCQGENLIIELDTDNDVFWPASGNETAQNPLLLENLQNDTTLIFYVSGPNGCVSNTDTIQVNVISNEYLPEIYSNDQVCSGDTLLISTDDIGDATYSWTVNNEPAGDEFEIELWGSQTEGAVLDVWLSVSVGECAEGTENYLVNILPLPDTIPIFGSSNLCEGDSLLLFTETPAEVSTIWTWSGNTSSGDTLFVPQNEDSTLVFLTPVLEGCPGPTTAQPVWWHVYPQADSVATNQPVCEGEILSLSAFSNNGEVIIHSPWGPSFLNGTMNLFPADTSYSGIYELQIFSEYCESEAEIELNVNPAPDVDLGNDSIYCEGSIAQFIIDNYPIVIWNGQFEQPGYQTNTSETIHVSVTNEFGCLREDSVLVIFEPCDGEVLNVFSPNGDGINDRFYFNRFSYDGVRCLIYNRWGQLICEISNLDYWDGKHCGNGRDVPEGTYFYILEYRTRENVANKKSGHFTLFR